MSIAEAPASNSDRDVVLAVDDNEQNLQLLEEYLWQWGYEVIVARDGREALQLYPQSNPSIIVLDVMMPVMDGYEACARIKHEPGGRTIPILMLTALTGTDDKIKALECGADDFLNKPINKDELRTRIRSLIKIRNLRKELDSSENIIMTLTTALENKDPRSGGHVHRVASYAARLAEKLGLSADERETIVKGAMLHDLGMIGIPDTLLTRSGLLTDDERARIADHTRMGASILEPMKTFRQFVPIVRWHHERHDGRGYPDGLRGEAIPLEAQVVGIANRFDEIHHEQQIPEEDALALLANEAQHGAFEPEVVKLFAAALAEEAPQAVAHLHLRPKPAPAARVLCIDDNKLNRDLLTATLTDAGFQVVVADNGANANDVIERENIDVVLLDLIMPVQDGAETLRLLRADPRFEFLPVIVLTSHRGAQLRQDAIVAGADDFINYPLNRLELVTRIRSLLRIKEYHADLEQTQNVICALALALEAKDNKQGPLTRDEFLRVIDHPAIGEEMVRPLLTLSSVLRMIRHHHERYDGRGYPDGLRGDDIPYEVRLMSIVDAYDALTSHRAYRPAPLTHEAALETLKREATGGKWDPAMVDAFMAMLGDRGPDWDAISQPVPALRLE